MDEFRRDARRVRLRIGQNFIEDVTDVLKRFFREIDDPVFVADLHPLWQDAASETPSSPPDRPGPRRRSLCLSVSSGIGPRGQRLECYKDLIRSLPGVNRTTLTALISHLYR